MARHANIPIFIPHLGCPNACVFCNQRTISGVEAFSVGEVRHQIEKALLTLSPDDTVEIAFFGGSFTGIDRDLMISLLEISRDYISSGRVSSVRCSTRPDYISEEILDILKEYGVRTVELGLQSRSTRVLDICRRGHGSEIERTACRMIVRRGFELVGQMMIGLPGSTLDDELDTARFIVDMGATCARIYPTVVFRDTELCYMTEQGIYIPLSVDEAVERSYQALRILEDGGVQVIRIGLCASENLASPEKYYAGPNHPAIGELVSGRMFYEKISDSLAKSGIRGGLITVYVPIGCISKAVGQKQINRLKLIDEFNLQGLKVKESNLLYGFEVDIIQEG